MQAVPRPEWAGRTVVCIASGPSLTKEDCDLVKASGCPTVVTNTTFRLAPWADVLFGFDLKWWLAHADEVRETFRGRLMSMSQIAKRHEIESLYGVGWFRQFGNSGACAISLAVAAEAKRVVLLGYDCQKGPKGMAHWHGDHPKELSNCKSIARWPDQFGKVASWAGRFKIPVQNASRETSLTCFPRTTLEDALR